MTKKKTLPAKEDMGSLHVRIPKRLIDVLDREAAILAKDGRRATRSDALRVMLSRASRTADAPADGAKGGA